MNIITNKLEVFDKLLALCEQFYRWEGMYPLPEDDIEKTLAIILTMSKYQISDAEKEQVINAVSAFIKPMFDANNKKAIQNTTGETV